MIVAAILLAASTAVARADVIRAAAKQIEERYVDTELAPVVAAKLRENAHAYDALADDAAFAEAVTKDLRESTGDLHFAMEHDPTRSKRLIEARSAEKRKLPEIAASAEELAEMRRRSFGFRRIERLDGNVALVEMTSFDDLKYSRDAATAALTMIGSADAVIFDIRSNPGGSGNLVGFLASEFIPANTPFMRTFDRELGETRTSTALAKMPVPRRLDVPLYILVGPGTGSAAEAFAFGLQQLGRAQVVGERTQGAAQGGGWVPVGGDFVIFIPNFQPRSAKTDKTWHKVGVLPDLSVPAPRALEAAHLTAVAALDKRESRPELRWLIPLLDLEANGAGHIDVADLPGKYQGIEITSDLKFIGASGVPRDLTPLSNGTFLIEDASVRPRFRARLRIVRDAGGKVTGVELLTPSGRVLPRPRL